MPNKSQKIRPENRDLHPERFLGSPLVVGINIGLNVITRVARHRSESERAAMVWLHNYAKHRSITADELCGELNLSRADIRRALSDPAEDLSRFMSAVQDRRHRFEQEEALFCETKVARTIDEAATFAQRQQVICEVIGTTRLGKTVAARQHYLLNMHQSIFVKAPEDQSDLTFLEEIAEALGISTSRKRANQLRSQIKKCFGKRGIKMLYIDEAHFLWPDKSVSKPTRIEFVRSLWDRQHPAEIGVLLLATPQYAVSMNNALRDSDRYAPGQWEGRAIRYMLPAENSERELRDIAKTHCPEADESMLDQLVTAAGGTQGGAGFMVNSINLARTLAGDGKLTLVLIRRAQKQMLAGSKVGQEIAQKLKGAK